MVKKLAKKVAVVTGAGKGIGAEIARELANAGAAVVVNFSSDKSGAEKVVKSIIGNGGQAVAIQADVGEPVDIDRLFAEADKAFGGRLDVLVNNAGIYRMGPLDQVTPEAFEKTFKLNVLGVILCCQAAAKRFSSEGGSIINVSSAVAAKGFPGSVLYSASKSAVDSVTRVLASELAPKKVRVNAINPGLVITEGTHAAGLATGENEKLWVSLSAFGRAATPIDIAPIVVFLASSDSGWLTGENFYATGGVR